jgi:hypothetical protein
VQINYVKGYIHTRYEDLTPQVEKHREDILSAYSKTVFCGKTTGSPPKRGVLGEAEILLKSDTIPVKQRPYQMTGECREAWIKLVDQLYADGKIEPGSGPWLSPSFPVPKKKPGTYRLVVDYRRLNEATIVDSHPLPRIGDILQRQGQFKIWSVLDMKDGYYQVPLKEEHRNLTCMATPRGTMRWRVLVMGLKNGNAIFQRVMESVLQDLPFADPYVDDVIIGRRVPQRQNSSATISEISDSFGILCKPLAWLLTLAKHSSLSGKWSSVATSSRMVRGSHHRGNCSPFKNGNSPRL